MGWPVSQDYNEAIQSPQTSFSEPELRGGQAVVNAMGMPMPCSGNFADVYQVTCPATRRTWAVKCFTRQIPGLQERYQQVSLYLAQVKLPFMVDFTFFKEGIRIRGDWYPILKMQWVEGLSLNAFVKDNLDKPQVLKMLCQIWVKLAKRLREADMAHCDLQHGNVLLVPGGKAGTLGVRLVDYDGMCVPALTLLKSIELGHPSFQHPQRLREGIYSLEVDRFSHLVIYTALLSLSVAGRSLWEKYDNGDNLLFKSADFEAPAKSALFGELLQLDDAGVRRLAEQLMQAISKPLDHVPLLTDLAGNGRAAPTAVQARASVESPQTAFASLTDAGAPSSPTRRIMRRREKLPAWAWGAGAVALLGLVVGGILLVHGRKNPAELPGPTALAQASPPETPAPPAKAGPPLSPPGKQAEVGQTVRPSEVPRPAPESKPELGKPGESAQKTKATEIQSADH